MAERKDLIDKLVKEGKIVAKYGSENDQNKFTNTLHNLLKKEPKDVSTEDIERAAQQLQPIYDAVYQNAVMAVRVATFKKLIEDGFNSEVAALIAASASVHLE